MNPDGVVMTMDKPRIIGLDEPDCALNPKDMNRNQVDMKYSESLPVLGRGRSQVSQHPVIFLKTQPTEQTCLEPDVKKRKVVKITPIYKNETSPSQPQSVVSKSESFESMRSSLQDPSILASLLKTSDMNKTISSDQPGKFIKDENNPPEDTDGDFPVKELGDEAYESSDFTCVKLDEWHEPAAPPVRPEEVEKEEKKMSRNRWRERRKQQSSRVRDKRPVKEPDPQHCPRVGPSILRRRNPVPPTNSTQLMAADMHSFIQKFVPKKLRIPVLGFSRNSTSTSRSKTADKDPRSSSGKSTDRDVVSFQGRISKYSGKAGVDSEHKPVSILRSSVASAEDVYRYKYPCHVCKMRFRTVYLYEEHVEMCQKNAPEKDQLELKLRNKLKKQSKTNVPVNPTKKELVKCTDCDLFWDALDLESVMRHKMVCPLMIKVDRDSPTIACTVCGMELESGVDMIRHCKTIHDIPNVRFLVNK